MVQLQAIMARRPASILPPGHSDQDTVAADMFSIPDDKTQKTRAYLCTPHSTKGGPHWVDSTSFSFSSLASLTLSGPSELHLRARRADTRPSGNEDYVVDAQVETLIDSNYQIRRELERQKS